MANINHGLISAPSMQDELGIVYLVETPQQFWSELEDSLQLPTDNSVTLSLLDSALKRSLSLCFTYYEQYLQTPLQLDRACGLLLDSELFQFHSERMCDIIMHDLQTTADPHSQFILYHIFLCHGSRLRGRSGLNFMRSNFFSDFKRWRSLLPLLMDHVLVDIDPDVEDAYFGLTGEHTTTIVPVPIEAKLRSLCVRLLYEVCRVQKLTVVDLMVFDDNFIDYLFDLVEDSRHMQDETFNYSVIKLITVLNEQYMVAELGEKTKESRNRVLRVLMRRLNSSKTFGENMIFMLNRAKQAPEDIWVKLVILKILYMLFTTPGVSECFYTSELRFLVDLFLRELVDLDEESDSLRHTYLRVLHHLLNKTQLRNIPYKRPQLVYALESLLDNSGMRDVNPTTRRLVERCLGGDWCVQFKKSRDADSGKAHLAHESSAFGPTGGEAAVPAAAVHLRRTYPTRAKTLKQSQSVENLTGRMDRVLRMPLDDLRTASNGSTHSLPSSVAIVLSPPLPSSSGRKVSEGTNNTQSSSPRVTSPTSPHAPTLPAKSPEGSAGRTKARRRPPPPPPKRGTPLAR